MAATHHYHLTTIGLQTIVQAQPGETKETLNVDAHRHCQQEEAEVEVHHQTFVISEMDRRHVTKVLEEVEEDLDEARHHFATLPFHLVVTLLSHLAILLSPNAIALTHLETLPFRHEDEEDLHLEEEVDGTIDSTDDENHLLMPGNPFDLVVVVVHHLDFLGQIAGRDLPCAIASLCDMMNGDHHLHPFGET